MTTPHPVRVTGKLESPLSRGLWLVKWLLLIPHVIVLALLGVAFAVLTVVAFFAILVTGRYPRVLFGFNAGVLRWAWRVAFYAYGANGTDQYPPFTLADVPDYPARLEIDYPARLSRGLVLVKWWLLAIPHYLVLAFLTGGGGAVVWSTDNSDTAGYHIGLIGALVLIGVIALLFTGRYPNGLFDLVVGLNRWVLRVTAYATLLTDSYPPFRLDQGEAEPVPQPPTGPSGSPGEAATPAEAPQAVAEQAVQQAAVQPGTAGPGTAPQAPPPSAGRSTALVIGSLLAALGVLTATVGLVGIGADAARDPAGFLQSGIGAASTTGYALRTEPIRIEAPAGSGLPGSVVGQVSVQAGIPNGQVFVGIARSEDVAGYLNGVAQGVWRGGDGRPGVREIAGIAPATSPAAQEFWVASATGPGEQSLTWTPVVGSWTAVVMNADASAPVIAIARVGAELPILRPVSGGVLGAGLGVLAIGIIVVVLGAVAGRRPADSTR